MGRGLSAPRELELGTVGVGDGNLAESLVDSHPFIFIFELEYIVKDLDWNKIRPRRA